MPEGDQVLHDVFVSLVTVVGAHNSNKLPILISQAVSELEFGYTNFELILVDNGLDTATFESVSALLEEVPCVRILKLSQSRDFDSAVFSGIEAAIGDFVAFYEIEIDPLPEALRALSHILSGADIVQGLVLETQGSRFRKISRKVFFKLSKSFTGLEIPSSSTYLTAFTRSVLNAIVASPSGQKYLRHLLGSIGFRTHYMEYDRLKNYAHRRRPGFTEAIEVLTSYSLRPLRFFSIVGLVAAIANLLYAAFVILTFLTSEVERGWASTNLQLGTMFFLLFLSLSVISEYLGRILAESQKSSAYVVKQELVSSRLISDEHRRNIG